jgi:DNA-binding FadR family transcriptional regulator
MDSFHSVKNQKISDRIAQQIKQAILDGAMKAGDRIQRTSIHELTEARATFEPTIARLASERVTSEDLSKLEHNIQETSRLLKSRSPASASSQNIEFHSLIAEATHNTVISLTMKTLFDVLKEMSMELTSDLPERMDVSADAIRYHRGILRAFREKDPEKAYELMLKHILQMQRGFNRSGSDNPENPSYRSFRFSEKAAE